MCSHNITIEKQRYNLLWIGKGKFLSGSSKIYTLYQQRKLGKASVPDSVTDSYIYEYNYSTVSTSNRTTLTTCTCMTILTVSHILNKYCSVGRNMENGLLLQQQLKFSYGSKHILVFLFFLFPVIPHPPVTTHLKNNIHKVLVVFCGKGLVTMLTFTLATALWSFSCCSPHVLVLVIIHVHM